jgi:hypothetical protein
MNKLHLTFIEQCAEGIGVKNILIEKKMTVKRLRNPQSFASSVFFQVFWPQMFNVHAIRREFMCVFQHCQQSKDRVCVRYTKSSSVRIFA